MALTDLRFLDEGSQWPPPCQEQRMARYNINEKLFNGDHNAVWGDWIKVLREDKDASLELVFNWHRRITKLTVDLMFSEPPRFTDGADEDDPNEDDPQKPAKPTTTSDSDPQTSDKADTKPSTTGGHPMDTDRLNDPYVPEDHKSTDSGTGNEKNSDSGTPKDAKAKPKSPANPRQDAIDRIIGKENNSYVNTLAEVGIDVSRFGNGLTKITPDDEGYAEIWAQPPTYWFPVVMPHNLRKVKNHVLAWVFEESDKKDPNLKHKYLWIEIHHKGMIEYRVHRIDGNLIGEAYSPQQFDPDQPDRVFTKVPDEFMVVPFAGMQTSTDIFGIDDYQDLDSIIQAIEIRAAQIARVLDMHTDPMLAGPPDQLVWDNAKQKWVFRSGGRYIEVDSENGEIPPEYIVWEGQLESQFQEIEMLLEQLYIISETSPAAFAQQKEGLAESGSALRRLMLAPLAKVARITNRFGPAAAETIRIAAKYEAANGKGTPPLDHIQIDWQDGLPGDPKELAETEQIRTGSKATSTQAASIQRLNGGTKEEAEAEAELINQEGQQQMEQTLAQTDAELAIAAKHAPPGETPRPTAGRKSADEKTSSSEKK